MRRSRKHTREGSSRHCEKARTVICHCRVCRNTNRKPIIVFHSNIMGWNVQEGTMTSKARVGLSLTPMYPDFNYFQHSVLVFYI